jgi:hypothetical protein
MSNNLTSEEHIVEQHFKITINCLYRIYSRVSISLLFIPLLHPHLLESIFRNICIMVSRCPLYNDGQNLDL